MPSWLIFSRVARTPLKWFTFCFSVAIVILGIASQIVGGIIINHYKEYIDHVDNKFIAVTAFIVFSGVLVTVVGIVGIIACFQQKAGIVTLFSTFLFIILTLEVVGGGLSFSYKHEVNDAVHKSMNSSLQNFSKNKSNQKFFNWVQKEFTCCGMKSSKDWTNSGQKIPSSCYKTNTAGKRTRLFKSGCESQFANFLRDNITVTGGIALAIAGLEVIGIIVAFLFRKAVQIGAYDVL